MNNSSHCNVVLRAATQTAMRWLTCCILGAVFHSSYVHAAESAESPLLMTLLPQQVSVAMEVNDFAQAVAVQSSYNIDNNLQDWGDFKKVFGVAPQQLAIASDGPLSRAKIFVGGEGVEVVVAKVKPTKIKPLLAKHYHQAKEHAQVVDGHLILATQDKAVQAIAAKIRSPELRSMPNGWNQLIEEEHAKNTDLLQLTWYVSPWLEQELQADSGKTSTSLANAKQHGLTAIRWLGGNIGYRDGQPTVASTYVYAPGPRSSTLKALNHFQPTRELSVPNWVPREVDYVGVAWLNLPRAFEHIDALFDDFYADGIEGTYRETLQDIRTELKVNLTEEIYANFKQQFCLLQTNDDSETKRGTLYAIEIKSPEIVSAAIRKLMQDDPGVKQVPAKGYAEPMWHVPPEKSGGEDFVFMVTNEHIFFSNNFRLVQRVLTIAPEETLLQSPVTRKTLAKLKASHAPSIVSLMLRGENHFGDSQEVSGRRSPINLIFGTPRKLGSNPSPQKDGFFSNSFLPRKYFRAFVVSPRENGWVIHSQASPNLEGIIKDKSTGD